MPFFRNTPSTDAKISSRLLPTCVPRSFTEMELAIVRVARKAENGIHQNTRRTDQQMFGIRTFGSQGTEALAGATGRLGRQCVLGSSSRGAPVEVENETLWPGIRNSLYMADFSKNRPYINVWRSAGKEKSPYLNISSKNPRLCDIRCSTVFWARP